MNTTIYFHGLYLYNKALTATKAENIQFFSYVAIVVVDCGLVDPT